jgi:hypothetical protein
MGVMDGLCPVDFETEADKEKRKVGAGNPVSLGGFWPVVARATGGQQLDHRIDSD